MSLPKTQTGIAFVGKGKPFEKLDVPIPEPKENELLIKVNVAGITPLDWKLREFQPFPIPSPSILGFDVVGTVLTTSPSNPSLKVGDHVLSQSSMGNWMNGAFQEYTVVDARYAAKVPKGLKDEDAVNFPINLFTSVASLFGGKEGGEHAGFGIPFPGTPESKSFDYAGTTILIVGGGSMCGRFGIELAHLAGIGQIITTASAAREAELKALGAAIVIDRKADDVEEQLRRVCGDDLIYIYDTATPTFDHSFTVSLLSNKRKGTLIHLMPGKISEEVAKSKVMGWEDRQMMGSMALFPGLAELYLKALGGWVERGEVKVPKYRVLKGLDAGTLNEVLDGYGEGKGERVNVVL